MLPLQYISKHDESFFNSILFSKKLTTVGINDWKSSDNSDDIIITYSLGSCLGVSFHDPILKVSALLHCQLPISLQSPDRVADNPLIFVDSGLLYVLNHLYSKGCKKKDLICKIAGCTDQNSTLENFNIGKRNKEVAKAFFDKNQIQISAEFTGGNQPKTMFLDPKNGETYIKTLDGVFML